MNRLVPPCCYYCSNSLSCWFILYRPLVILDIHGVIQDVFLFHRVAINIQKKKTRRRKNRGEIREKKTQETGVGPADQELDEKKKKWKDSAENQRLPMHSIIIFHEIAR